MSAEFFIIIAVVIAGFIGIFLMMRRSAKPPEDDRGFLMLQNQLNEVTRTLDTRLGEGNKAVAESLRAQFGESQRLIKEITQEITSVKEIGRQTQNYAEQLQSLQDILKNPKQRGVLGEYYLEALLKNVLPPGSYQMQYLFANGEIVDAVVFVKDKVIPIDSKFSLENYNRMAEAKDPAERERLGKIFLGDLKNRIVETAKYIRPAERTTDFAFMFIPHEAIYYDLLVNKVGAVDEDTENLVQRAAGKYKVIIVSPTSFLAYLQTVLQGLKALQIEEKAQEIIKRVGELGRHVGKYDEFMEKLGNHLGTTVNAYNTAYKELGKIDKDVLKITGTSPELEPIALDRPHMGEDDEA